MTNKQTMATNLLLEERKYQNEKWSGIYDDSEWSPNDWIVFIRRYCNLVNAETGNKKRQMDNIRKIGALAMAAIEHNLKDTPGRM